MVRQDSSRRWFGTRRALSLRADAGRAPGGLEPLERRALMSADLTLSNLSIQEATAPAGSEIHTLFTYTNLGDAFEAAWNIELRLSTDEVWGNADDVVLAVERESEDLESGQSSDERESVIVPGITPAGTYRLAVFIDSSNEIAENSESNNIAFSAGTITITAGGGSSGGGGLDLAASDASGTLLTGDDDEIVATYTYTNAGGAFNGFFDQEFRLSLNQVWGDADDIVLGVEREIEDLLPGQSSVESESFALPAGIAAGEYFLGVMVDSSGVVSETNENNNIAWSAQTIALGGGVGGGTGVDLSVERVLANPTPRPVGEDIEIAWTIVNAGGSFNGAFDQQVRLSVDSVWGNGDDIILGVEREDEDFTPGQRSGESESFVIPGGTAPGQYYVMVRVDASEEHAETDEGNNIAVSASRVVTVGDRLPGDDRFYAIFSGGRDIRDDDYSPSRDNGTAYGRKRVDGVVAESRFEVHNFGTGPLGIEDVRLRGRHRDDFCIVVSPDDTIAPGASTVVVVRFDPSKGGLRKSILVVDTDRDNDDRYEFRLRGTGVVPADAPDAAVVGRGGTEIGDDDYSAGGGDGTRFNTIDAGQVRERTFTLRNQGVQSLVLTTPLLRLTGAGAGAFSIVSMPAGTLAPGASTSFTIRFAPSSAGRFAANIELLSNDPDESIYDFRIVGRAL